MYINVILILMSIMCINENIVVMCVCNINVYMCVLLVI